MSAPDNTLLSNENYIIFNSPKQAWYGGRKRLPQLVGSAILSDNWVRDPLYARLFKGYEGCRMILPPNCVWQHVPMVADLKR